MNNLLENQKSREECVEYLKKEGILNYFEIGEEQFHGIFDAVDENNFVPFEPVPEDLYRLHTLIRRRKVFNVLEFGLGYSTIVMADALMKNSKEFYSLYLSKALLSVQYCVGLAFFHPFPFPERKEHRIGSVLDS